MVGGLGPLPFCIDWLPDGRLLVVSGRDGRVLRREPDGSLVDPRRPDRPRRPARGTRSWSTRRGNAYVNNIGFDFPGGEFAPGSVALVTPDGEARQVADGVAFPNGMAITPDGATLIVAESYANRLTAFDIAAGRRPVGPARLGRARRRLPDGICLDADGAVWYADVPNRAASASARAARCSRRSTLDRGCFACMLGGDDGRTLFVVANEWGGPESMAGGARPARC